MTTKTILTPIQVDSLLDGVLRASGSRLGNYTLQKTLDELRSAVRAIEQSVLQSPEIQALKRDKERLDWLEASEDSHGFCHAGYGDYIYYAHQEEGYPSVREVIDAAMEQKK